MPRKAKDYNDGKVYVVRNTVNDKLYVGSTTQSLSRRWSKHKCNALTKHTPFYKAVNELGVEKFYIELVENYPCNSQEELNRREGHFIREYDTYNKGYNSLIAGRTQQEYQDENQAKIIQYRKKHHQKNKDAHNQKWTEYYADNKEAIIERQKQYVRENAEAIKDKRKTKRECPHCKKELTLYMLPRHIKYNCQVVKTIII